LYPGTATEEAPLVAARWGVQDLELMLQTAGEYDPAFIKLVKANVTAAGGRVHALHSFQSLHPMTTPYARRTEEAIALFRRAIDAAVELGAGAIVWHGLSRQEATGPAAWEAFLRSTERLAAFCAEAGVTLAIENVSWCILSSVRDVMAFAARILELGPPGSVGFAFDPFQAAEAGANPFMILAAMEGAIADVHLSDHRECDPAQRHLLPGDGDLPWPALIRAIAGSGYDGPMMIEGAIPDADAVARARSRLEPLIDVVRADEDPCAGPPPAGVLEGISLFNERQFYEAHETLEHEWHAERRPIRRLYQGILQIGVGFHHARGGNHRGAVLLLTDGIEKVSGFLPSCQGIDTARLLRESQVCLDQIEALGPEGLERFDWELLPTIEDPVTLR
jgi:sugar phosphate isomerase/epimerase/predicted metal-dependent hydrolase